MQSAWPSNLTKIDYIIAPGIRLFDPCWNWILAFPEALASLELSIISSRAPKIHCAWLWLNVSKYLGSVPRKLALNHICIWSFLFDFPRLESIEISLLHFLWNILNQRWNVVFYLSWITQNTYADIFRCFMQGTYVFRWSWHIWLRSTFLMFIRDPTSCNALHQPYM